MVGASRKVHALLRVRGHVIELVGISRRVNELEAPAPQHHDRCNSAFCQVFADCFVVAAVGALCVLCAKQMRYETLAIERIRPNRGRFAARHFHQRGQQIEMRDRLVHTMRVEPLRRMNDQRYPAAPLEERHLVPEPPLAEHLTMIGCHDDHGIFREP